MLKVMQGNVLQLPRYLNIDTVVVGTNAKGYSNNPAGTTYSILQELGVDVRKELIDLCKERNPKVGDVLRTSGGAFCASILHLVVAPSPVVYLNFERLDKLLQSLLAYCRAQGVTRFATSLLGVASSNLSAVAVLDLFEKHFGEIEDIECIVLVSDSKVLSEVRF